MHTFLCHSSCHMWLTRNFRASSLCARTHTHLSWVGTRWFNWFLWDHTMHELTANVIFVGPRSLLLHSLRLMVVALRIQLSMLRWIANFWSLGWIM